MVMRDTMQKGGVQVGKKVSDLEEHATPAARSLRDSVSMRSRTFKMLKCSCMKQ
jgi:hypothetical protein